MKILIYCQHVLGIGHFFRTLEICRAFHKHRVILVTGGQPVDAVLPEHVREVALPPLMTDSDFKNMYSPDSTRHPDEVKRERREILRTLFAEESPDLFLIELYPFGRKAFRFELDPLLEDIRSGLLPPCRVVCSLRDILVEKKDAAAYEKRVIRSLNRYFHALLVHADPKLLTLEETFSATEQISVPIIYTGFVTPGPAPDAREKMRGKLDIPPEILLTVASAGGGKVGFPLLHPVCRAFSSFSAGKQKHRLLLFSGPFMDEAEYRILKGYEGENIRISRFSRDFLSLLAAADLSVSMGGYNTCMNIMAAKVPALIWPFAQNREQMLRAKRLRPFGGMGILSDADLQPEKLAVRMQQFLCHPRRPAPHIDLNGAENTRRWAESGEEKSFCENYILK